MIRVHLLTDLSIEPDLRFNSIDLTRRSIDRETAQNIVWGLDYFKDVDVILYKKIVHKDDSEVDIEDIPYAIDFSQKADMVIAYWGDGDSKVLRDKNGVSKEDLMSPCKCCVNCDFWKEVSLYSDMRDEFTHFFKCRCPYNDEDTVNLSINKPRFSCDNWDEPKEVSK